MEASNSEQVFMLKNTLWWGWSPGSGQAIQWPKITKFITSKNDDSNYNSTTNDIVKWATKKTPTIKGKSGNVYMIPYYNTFDYTKQHELSIWGGGVKPKRMYYLTVTKEQDYYIVNLFNNKTEAVSWVK